MKNTNIIHFFFVMMMAVAVQSSCFAAFDNGTFNQATFDQELNDLKTETDSNKCKKMFHTLSLKYHSDKNPNNIEKADTALKLINDIYKSKKNFSPEAIAFNHAQANAYFAKAVPCVAIPFAAVYFYKCYRDHKKAVTAVKARHFSPEKEKLALAYLNRIKYRPSSFTIGLAWSLIIGGTISYVQMRNAE